VTMTQTGKTRSFDGYQVMKAFTSTTWAIGTGMWAGLALSG
jgi:hypothetical protein